MKFVKNYLLSLLFILSILAVLGMFAALEYVSMNYFGTNKGCIIVSGGFILLVSAFFAFIGFPID